MEAGRDTASGPVGDCAQCAELAVREAESAARFDCSGAVEFVDVVWSMARVQGRSPAGERCCDHVRRPGAARDLCQVLGCRPDVVGDGGDRDVGEAPGARAVGPQIEAQAGDAGGREADRQAVEEPALFAGDASSVGENGECCWGSWGGGDRAEQFRAVQ